MLQSLVRRKGADMYSRVLAVSLAPGLHIIMYEMVIHMFMCIVIKT